MKKWMDRLNLQPQERRALLGVMVLAAVVLNYWFVWPQFGEWGRNQAEIVRLNARKSAYVSEIGRKGAYESKLRALEKSGAGGVLKEEEANKVQATIYEQAALHNVSVPQVRPGRATGGTNAFFDEQVMTVEVTAAEADLIGFLFALGSSDSMIRVRELSRLRLDPSQTRLNASITFVASFQKVQKAPAASPPGAPGTNGAAAALQPKGPQAGARPGQPGAGRPVSTNVPAGVAGPKSSKK